VSNDHDVTGACAPIYRAIYQTVIGNTGAYNEAVAGEINGIGDLRESLRTSLTVQASPEPEPEYFKPLDYPRQEIDYVVPDDVLAELLRRTEGTFVALAQSEPHWAVITNDMFLADRIDHSKEQFYETGLHNMAQLDWFLERHGIETARLKTCFELGSGVGRVTLWLARKFERVIASDVSGRMLELANEYISARGLNNVDYATLNRFSQFSSLQPFDLFYSSIVLQHNTPPVQRHMLSTILSKLNPGGVALFQVIGGVRHYRFNAQDYIADLAEGPRIEMHPFIHRELFAVAAEQNCHVLELREEGSCGPTKDMISNIIFVQKAR
jgi:2-polyprenyl-3-methyl-5-hydroxy-6-metoxy-1,4-benzoquinol methylase